MGNRQIHEAPTEAREQNRGQDQEILRRVRLRQSRRLPLRTQGDDEPGPEVRPRRGEGEAGFRRRRSRQEEGEEEEEGKEEDEKRRCFSHAFTHVQLLFLLFQSICSRTRARGKHVITRARVYHPSISLSITQSQKKTNIISCVLIYMNLYISTN